MRHRGGNYWVQADAAARATFPPPPGQGGGCTCPSAQPLAHQGCYVVDEACPLHNFEACPLHNFATALAALVAEADGA